MDYLEICCLVSKRLKISLLPVLVCTFTPLLSEDTLYNFHLKKLIVICVFGPECGLSRRVFHGCLKRVWILLLLGKVFLKGPLDQVVWWCFRFSYTPADLVTSSFITCLEMCCQSLQLLVNLLLSPFSSISFLLHVLHVFWKPGLACTPTWGCYFFLGDWLLYHYGMSPSLLVVFFPPRLTGSYIHIVTLLFFWVMFVWGILKILLFSTYKYN